MNFAQSSPVAGDERARPRIAPKYVACGSAMTSRRILLSRESFANELVEAELFGAGNLHHTIHWRAHGYGRDRLRDVVGSHRLNENGRQVYGVAFGSRGRNALDELEELGRVDDRVASSIGCSSESRNLIGR